MTASAGGPPMSGQKVAKAVSYSAAVTIAAQDLFDSMGFRSCCFDGTCPNCAPDLLRLKALRELVGLLEEAKGIARDKDAVGTTEAGANAVADYLREHGVTVPFSVTHEKPAALVYLDDRAMRFNGPGTFPSAQDVHNARPWNIAQRPHSRQAAASPSREGEGRV